MCPSPRVCSRNCARTGTPRPRAPGSSPIARAPARSMSPSRRRPTCSRSSAPASSNRAASMPCGTPSPPICSRPAKTSTPCSASSGTGTSPRPCGISTSVRAACSRPAPPWICRSRPPPEPWRRRRPPPRASARRLRGESTSPISSGPTAPTIDARIGWLALSIALCTPSRSAAPLRSAAIAPSARRAAPSASPTTPVATATAPNASAWPPNVGPPPAAAKVFRGRYLAGLQRAFDRGDLHLTDGLASLAAPAAFAAWLAELRQSAWVVYCKPPFAGPDHVLAYLGRYTHRVALSNDRLLGLADGRVRFRWRDYADGDRVKVLDLDVDEFLRRFLLHIVPDGFVRIRHFGLLANRRRAAALAQCRVLLMQPPVPPASPESVRELMLRVTGTDIARCPVCQQGVLHQVEVLPPAPATWDTS